MTNEREGQEKQAGVVDPVHSVVIPRWLKRGIYVVKTALKQALCKHSWRADYMSGTVYCCKCDWVSKRNYYDIRIGEKY